MVSGTLSPSSSECFSPFPHGTRSLSVSRECSALPGGPGGFAQDSSCPALLRIPLHRTARLRVRASHPLRGRFPAASPRRAPVDGAVLQPRRGVATAPVWASPRSLAATGGIIVYFLFLEVLGCFGSLRSPRRGKRAGDSPSDCRVVPFGHLRVTGHLHLTADFRSLPRPSSPP